MPKKVMIIDEKNGRKKPGGFNMAIVTMKQLLEAGVHFGHQTRRWNPKMARYIFTERNGIYIIDLQQTVKMIDVAYNFVRDIAADGKDILFVGTKKQAQNSIENEAKRSGSFYVNHRWLGGTLTNYETISKRISRLKDLKTMEEDGTFELLPKKEVIKLRREREKLQKFLGGIEEMKGMPGAMIVIDSKKERIAIAEAQKLGIPKENSLVLEDTGYGVRAAYQAGLHVIMVPSINPPSEEEKKMAYRVVSSLHDVIDLLKG